MAKYFSTGRPEKVARFDQKTLLVAYNIAAAEQNEESGFEYDIVKVAELSKPAIVEALVRERYSVSDELALLRQRNTKKAEFSEYNDFVEGAKTLADEILATE